MGHSVGWKVAGLLALLGCIECSPREAMYWPPSELARTDYCLAEIERTVGTTRWEGYEVLDCRADNWPLPGLEDHPPAMRLTVRFLVEEVRRGKRVVLFAHLEHVGSSQPEQLLSDLASAWLTSPPVVLDAWPQLTADTAPDGLAVDGLPRQPAWWRVSPRDHGEVLVWPTPAAALGNRGPAYSWAAWMRQGDEAWLFSVQRVPPPRRIDYPPGPAMPFDALSLPR